MEKVHIEKNTVQETLVIPLYGRKLCTERFPSLFQDRKAVELIDRLDYDFSALEKRAGSLGYQFGALEVAMRESDLLWELRDYRETHPRAALVNLGCGLDQTAENADNGLCRIVNIDLPDGMAHGELALVYPERLYAEAVRFLAGEGAKCNMEQADERDRPARRLGQTFMI